MPIEASAKPHKEIVKEERGEVPPNVQETINEAREDVDIVVQNLIDWKSLNFMLKFSDEGS